MLSIHVIVADIYVKMSVSSDILDTCVSIVMV